MTLLQVKKLFTDNSISMEGKTLLKDLQELAMSQGLATRIELGLEAEVGTGFADFLNSRSGATAKVETREGTGGQNPLLFKVGQLQTECLEPSVEMNSANGKLYYRTKCIVDGISTVFVNSNTVLEVGGLYTINARVLGPGTYMDADASGAQRELVVPAGRKLVYNPEFGARKLTVQKLQIQFWSKKLAATAAEVDEEG